VAIGVMVVASVFAALAAARPSAVRVRVALMRSSVACALGLVTVMALSVN
jgi:hypothetical protein